MPLPITGSSQWRSLGSIECGGGLAWSRGKLVAVGFRSKDIHYYDEAQGIWVEAEHKLKYPKAFNGYATVPGDWGCQ